MRTIPAALLALALAGSAAAQGQPEPTSPPIVTSDEVSAPVAAPAPRWSAPTPPPPPPADAPVASTPPPPAPSLDAPLLEPQPQPEGPSAMNSAARLTGEEEPGAEPVWYGWNFLLIDPMAIGTMVYGYFGARTDALVLGLATYLVNGPLIHLLHGRVKHAGLSFLARVVTPPLVLLSAASDLSCSSDACGANAAVVLLGVGVVIAWLYDVVTAEENTDPPALDLAASMGFSSRGTPVVGISLRL